MENKPHKVAFVASGGGMVCAYGAGVAWALQDSGVRPDIFIGSSGSAGTVSYYACGQADIAARLWVEEVTDPRVLQRRPLRLDVDFIVDSMRERFPFAEERLRSASADLYLAATDYGNVRTRFFSNHEEINWYEVMRASMAIPFVYARHVMIEGRRYFDGDISTTLADCIALAKEKGATTIYVCDTDTTSYMRSAWEIGLAPLVSKDFVKSLIGLLRKKSSGTTTEGVTIVHLAPSAALKGNSLDNSKEAIEQAVQKGYAETSLTLKQKGTVVILPL